MTPLSVFGVGARCPLGLTALESAMGIRAGKLEPRGSRFTDARGHAIGICRARFLSDDVHGLSRLVRLAAPAMAEATGAHVESLPLVVAVPEAQNPLGAAVSDDALLDALAAASGLAVDRARSVVVRAGHAGFAAAASIAMELAASDGRDVLVGGVDTSYDPDVLAWLDAAKRLHAPGVEDGILPSEAAAFLRVGRPRPGATTSGRITWAATAREETVTRDEPNTAAAMTGLVDACPAPIGWVLVDVNGEQHRVEEWTSVVMRMGDKLDGARRDRLPDEIGDVGAASGALFAAIACVLGRARCAPARSVLVALHSEGAERGAVALEVEP